MSTTQSPNVATETTAAELIALSDHHFTGLNEALLSLAHCNELAPENRNGIQLLMAGQDFLQQAIDELARGERPSSEEVANRCMWALMKVAEFSHSSGKTAAVRWERALEGATARQRAHRLAGERRKARRRAIGVQ